MIVKTFKMADGGDERSPLLSAAGRDDSPPPEYTPYPTDGPQIEGEDSSS